MRVRFAPSPTGRFHIGGVRTALFNWLFARKQGGAFILRIEDTDRARSRPEYERDIFESLSWLGLLWDEGPAPAGKPSAGGSYRQSERLGGYADALRKLLEMGAAYRCFCTKELLELTRQAELAQGLAPKYNGRCRGLDSGEVAKRLRAGDPSIIRFKTPEKTVSVRDLIRGAVTFDMALVGDFAIAKSEREPLYNFSAVVDDYDMRISHVIRGEEHLANTPKQMLLQTALGFPHPQYAHLPLILNPDRSKMSKRFAATAVHEYREQGYLPEALVNFLALLGWHPPGDREVLTRDDMVRLFDLGRVQKAGAVFNVEKLNWLNAQYIRRSDPEILIRRLKELGQIPSDVAPSFAAGVFGLVRDRLKKLSDFSEAAQFFFVLPEYPNELLSWKGALPAFIREQLRAAAELARGMNEEAFSRSALGAAFESITRERGRGEVLWPLRVALSGREASPGPFEMMEVFGKEESIRRIRRAIEKLADREPSGSS